MDPIFLKAGDTVKGTGIKPYGLPNITATINPAADTVNGLAPANKYFEVDLEDVSYNWYWRWVGSNASGNYSTDFSGDLDIQPNQILAVWVFYTDPVTGNDTYYNYLTRP